MMLHQEYCPHCNRKNTYFDDSFKVNQQIEDDVSKVLNQIQNQLGLTNQAKEDQKTEEDDIKKSLKSVRGQPKKPVIMAPSTGVDKEEEPTAQGPKEPAKNIISVWKCRECNFFNKFGESSECSNSKNCNYNLQYEEDLGACIMDMDELSLE